MKITTPEAYRKALNRVSELRAAGGGVDDNAELAELEGALAAYSVQGDEPDKSKGKPTADPYGKAINNQIAKPGAVTLRRGPAANRFQS